jgi:uncharacterized protein (TIGR03437 family)
MSIGTIRLACVTVLAVAATAAPASRPLVRARHVAPARSFRPYMPDRYVVVLKDPPVAERFSTRANAGSAAAAGYGREIAAKQAAVASELAARHITVSSQVSHLMNALFVSAPGHTIEELRAIPGVQSVTPMRRLRARLNRAEQLVDVSTAWNAVGGQSNAGKGIKIAILDSGIDLTNPAFQDSSLTAPSGFPLCSGFPGSGTACSTYTNSKVIVARSYVQLLGAGSGSNPAANSDPDDPFPHDRFGHGTATAMIAAGNSITAPAISTGGSPIALQGMASKAYIGVYKISGTFGYTSEEAAVQALEDAVKDGMDVISMSYGALAITNWSNDPFAKAFELAATSARPAGALASSIPIPVVVAAAGNDGADAIDYGYNNYPSFNTINSPSSAPDVISVGASTSSHIMQPTVSATAAGAPSNVKNIVALIGDSGSAPGESLQGANIATLVDVSKIGDATACTALSANSLKNSFALISPGACDANTAGLNAQNAGAVGFIFIEASGTAVAAFDSGPTGMTAVTGPAVAISNADGLNLEAYIDAHPGQATIDFGGQEEDISTLSAYWVSLGGNALSANMVAGYSSFGPTPDGLLKPDLVATGGWDTSLNLYGGFYVPTQSFDAYDSELYSANGFMAVDGSSFSTALTAGAAALAIQAHPGLARGTQVRSLIVNSTAQTVTTDDSDNAVDAQWIGAGLLDAGAATSATLTAEPTVAGGSGATVSFGYVSGPASQTITITNLSSSPVVLAPKVSCCTINGVAGSMSGATVTASLSSSALGAGGTATLTVSLSGAPSTSGEYSGSITLGSGSLHIPFMLIVAQGTNCSSSGDNCGIEPNFSPESTVLEGAPGTDTGGWPYLQVTDEFGVPVEGASVTFTVSPAGTMTLNSVSGAPACSPASSSSSITCPTDKYGWAWMDPVLGSTAAQPTITFVAAGESDVFYANIQTAPSISTGGVADAASYATKLVPGSYAAIFGSNLSDVALDVFSLQCPTGACVYPLAFDSVSVSFDVSGATYPGYPYFVSPGQVNLIVPWELEGQTSAQVKLSIDAQYAAELFSNVITVPIANYAPAFFVSCGAACALDSNYSLITTSNPAKRGQYISLFANSLGPVTNPPGDGVPASASPLSWTTTTPVVTIGGASANVIFSGLAPGYQGLYQINVQVPQSANTGSVPISLQIGGATTPAASIPVQ